MMRWVAMAPLLLVLVLFALSNRQEVRLGLWPTDVSTTMPLWLMVLGLGAMFFLIGAVMVWLAEAPTRRRLVALERSAASLAAELTSLRAERAEAETPAVVPALARLP